MIETGVDENSEKERCVVESKEEQEEGRKEIKQEVEKKNNEVVLVENEQKYKKRKVDKGGLQRIRK